MIPKALRLSITCILLLYIHPVFSQKMTSSVSDDSSFIIEDQSDGDQDQKTSNNDTTIVVTGTKNKKRLKDTPIITEVISEKEIKNSGAKSLRGVMEDYGLQFYSSEMGSYIRLQGMGGSKILFLINGRRITGRTAQRLDADSISLANVKRIEIIRGPQSALYGSDGLGGVVNIITKETSGDIDGSITFINSFMDTDKKDDYFFEQEVKGNISLPSTFVNSSFYFDCSKAEYYNNDETGVSYTPKYRNYLTGIDLSSSLNEKWKIMWGGSYAYRKSDSQTNTSGGYNRKEITRSNGYLDLQYDYSAKTSVQTKLYHNYYHKENDKYLALSDSWENAGKEETEHYTEGEILTNTLLSKHNMLTVGMNASLDRLKKYNLDDINEYKSKNSQAFILQDEQFSENRYSIVTGIRFERDSNFGYFAAPKISSMYYFVKNFRIFSGCGVGYRTPNFNDLYLNKDTSGHPAVLGNENLDPEKSIGINFGCEYTIKKFFWQINFFHNELWDEIVNELQSYQSDDGRDVYIKENVGRSYNSGFDCEAQYTIFRHIKLSTAYNYLYAYDRSDETRLKEQPTHIIRGKIAYDNTTYDFLTYFRIRHVSSAEDLDKPSFTFYDYYISKTFFDHFRFFAMVENITDKVHHDSGLSKGRYYSLGVEAKI